MIKNSADINLKNSFVSNCLHIVTSVTNNNDKLKCIKYFVENKISLHEKDFGLNSVLIYACKTNSNVEIFEYLLEKKCDINIDKPIQYLNLKLYEKPELLLFLFIFYGLKVFSVFNNFKNKNKTINHILSEFKIHSTLWSTKRFKLYPEVFRNKVYTFLICLSHNKLKIPKTILDIIFSISSINN